MALMKLRGEQLKDAIIKNRHLAEKIVEANLDINWDGHYRQALETRKLVDYVQVNGIAVTAGANEVNLTGLGIIPASDPKAGSNELNVEGVIIDAPKNKAVIRDAGTGEPLLGPDNAEVYGRIVFDETANAFKLKLVYFDGEDEVVFAPAANITIDFQYARRFNLADIDELFAANEKFVDGAADVTSTLNIVQLAKDLYGAGYQLDRTGNAKLAKSIVEQIAEEVARATAAEEDLQDAIDTEVLARQQAITNLLANLASTEVGKGASLIGIADAAGKFAATNVEQALLELKQDIEALAGGTSGLSLSSLDARVQALETEVTGARGSFANLNARLVKIEGDIAAEAARAQAAEAGLNNRLTAVETEFAAKKHVHYKFTVTITEATSVVNLPPEAPAFEIGNNSLDVYVYGVLQEAGVNYAELPDGRGVDFAPEILQAGDKVTFRYYVNE